ncbi:MAG: 2-oxoacid:acceptor oxidoreductase subunit alpha [Bacteroidales bacterium]|jgi:2-oxoglutarate ferredoxin oxidoreductase subunit alpha|nr:2-oxoacid:acceptor oxidoreductase subunit alpha [Bacteroidales bacterium]
MTEQAKIIELEDAVIRFSGDSGDGMQLVGNIFSNLSAVFGNEISTFPDYPAEIRAPQGSLSGVSGFQVRLGSRAIFTSGDKADVLIAMNPAALKVNAGFLKKNSIVIINSDSFQEADLKKAEFATANPFEELGLNSLFVQVVSAPIDTLVKESLADSGLDNKARLRSKNMFALGLTCWLLNRPLEYAFEMLKNKFKKKEQILHANIKVLTDGYNYGHNVHASVSTFRVEAASLEKGLYTDVQGNRATALGLIAAAEKAGLELFLGSYPITPATEILQELSARKELGVKAVQAEDEIAGICSAIGASFAGNLAATSTSGPGLALKSEAIGLAVMAELPLVVIDVQRGGPSTGLPTKTEQSDLLQALYGRNGESPAVVMAATSPSNCFDAAYMASKIALEHLTPVILLTDGFLANGSSAWKLPDLEAYPEINPPYVSPEMKGRWKSYLRDEETSVRYWAIPGTEGFAHRLGGLEKDFTTSAISTDPANHQRMVEARQSKIDKIAVPYLKLTGHIYAELLVTGWGGTYGHLYSAVHQLVSEGKEISLAHFSYINPLPSNTFSVFSHFKKIVVCELNNGQFATYLRSKAPEFNIVQYNKIQGQPFTVNELVEHFTKLLEEK